MPDPTPTKIPVRGCTIALMRGGAGRPLLILHGASDAGDWLPYARSTNVSPLIHQSAGLLSRSA